MILSFWEFLRKEKEQHLTFFHTFVIYYNNDMTNNIVLRSLKAVTMLMLSLIVVSCGMLNRNAGDIINDMRDARNAQYVNVGSGLLGLGKLISPTLYESNIGISSVQVLDLSKCSESVREKFRKRIQNLYKVRSYEEVFATQRDYGQQSVLVRRDGRYISEIVIANANGTTDAMVVVNGHINMENLERIVNDQKSFFNR